MIREFVNRILTDGDFDIAVAILGGHDRSIYKPDLIIAPDGKPYLYRWHLLPHKGPQEANVYFHIQVASDPQVLHDHPWDNSSVILAGSYTELFEPSPELVAPEYSSRWEPNRRVLRKGDMVFRKATTAHRLILPHDIPYAMTLFTTGPYQREWGFWYPDGWHSYKRHVEQRDGLSVHVNRGE